MATAFWARPSAVAERVRAPVNRQMTMMLAIASTTEDSAQPTNAIEPAVKPAVRPTAPSTVIQARLAHASQQANLAACRQPGSRETSADIICVASARSGTSYSRRPASHCRQWRQGDHVTAVAEVDQPGPDQVADVAVVEAVVDDLARPAELDQPEGPQQAEVLRDRRLADPHDRGQVAGAHLLAEEDVDDSGPGGVTQRVEQGRQLGVQLGGQQPGSDPGDIGLVHAADLAGIRLVPTRGLSLVSAHTFPVWAASESRASECARRPATTSVAMKATIRQRPKSSRPRSASGPSLGWRL